MAELEKLIEEISSDLVIIDIDDLPALSQVHGKFENYITLARETNSDAAKVAEACTELVKKIILSEIDDKASALKGLNEALGSLQVIVRDKKNIHEVPLPAVLDLSDKTSEPEKSPESSGAAEESAEEEQRHVLNFVEADTSLMGEFITEAREHCSSAEQMMMDLETGEDKDGAINAIFRSFHTIKGAAGFLDIQPINHVAHESETLLDMGRKGTIAIEGKIADVIFDSIDILRRLLDSVEECLSSGAETDVTELITPILETLREILKDPDSFSFAESSDRVGDKLVDMGIVDQKKIDEALQHKESDEERIGQTLVKQKVVSAKTVAKALRDQQQTRKEKQGSSNAVKEMVKIDTERLDRMVDTIGELVIAESMVGQNEEILSNASHEVARNISHLNKITRELQEMGMAMRLVPVRGTFQKLARAVRDLTRKSGKKVELKMQGEDTEVDRSIIQLIGDPLMHMIRNSVDHGIESPEERAGTDKPEIGKVSLRAYHKGGNIYFDIEDDGRGLNKDMLYNKAIEKGLIEPGKEMTDQEIYQIIFMPGFSTAKQITDISGRGVGMDVVKRNIDAMRGNLEIESELGRGTKFAMKLPLTLAIIDGMLVDIEKEKYIIPTLSVVESLSLTPDMISTVTNRGELINLRGELLPLIRINRLFDLNRKGENTNAESTVVVVEDNSRKIGLVIDKLLGQRQTVIKSLGKTFSRQKWISGGAILSNGNIGLIIDIGGVIGLADEIKEELYSWNSRKNLETDKPRVDLEQIKNEEEKDPEDVSAENTLGNSEESSETADNQSDIESPEPDPNETVNRINQEILNSHTEQETEEKQLETVQV